MFSGIDLLSFNTLNPYYNSTVFGRKNNGINCFNRTVEITVNDHYKATPRGKQSMTLKLLSVSGKRAENWWLYLDGNV